MVTDTRYGAAGWYCKRNLEKLGHKVFTFNYRQETTIHPLVKKISLIRWIVTNSMIEIMNHSLEKTVFSIKPDFLFVIKGMTIYPSTLEKIKKFLHIPLINWYFDSPFNPINSSKYVLESFPLYDYWLSVRKIEMQEIKGKGVKNVIYFPCACDPDIHRYIEPKNEEQRQLRSDICWIGTFAPERAPLLSQLTDYNLAIWGNMWEENLGRYSPLRKHYRGKAIYGDEVARRYAAAKIVLNSHRPQDPEGTNMRTFEVLGCRAFLLVDRKKEQSELFKEGEELECYVDFAELKDKVSYYLRQPEKREKIARKGQEKVYQKHTYLHRMQYLISLLRKI
jgi:spore maturation protein CgeB